MLSGLRLGLANFRTNGCRRTTEYILYEGEVPTLAVMESFISVKAVGEQGAAHTLGEDFVAISA